MKILYVTQGFFPDHKGGTELYLLRLCKQILRSNHLCEILCVNDYVAIAEEYSYNEIPVHKISKTLNLNYEIKNLVKTESFDIIHIHSFGGKIDNKFLQCVRMIGVPIFFTPHLAENFCLNGGTLRYKNKYNCDGYVNAVKCQTCISVANNGLPSMFKYRVFQFLLQRIVPRIISKNIFSEFHFLGRKMKNRIGLLKDSKTNIVALSEWYEQLLKLNGLQNINLIPQAVDSAFIPNELNNNKVPNDKLSNGFKWVFVGRLSPEKGIYNLIEIFIKNSKEEDSLLLILFLNQNLNEFETNILEMVKDHTNIVIHQNCSSKGISMLLRNSNCLVLPSKVCEMAPLVLEEAFASNIPVLVSNYIQLDIEIKRLGVKFDYNVKFDFETKFNYMRTFKEKSSFKGLNSFKPISFNEVADLHISLYSSSLKKI